MPEMHATAQKNHLLAALPTEIQSRLLPKLELLQLPLGKVLYESGDALRHVYFPIDSIVSLLYVMENGASAEISVVGNEGLIGVAVFMGGESTTSRAIVQSAGYAYRLPSRQFMEEVNRYGDRRRGFATVRADSLHPRRDQHPRP
jgi:CRP-like cAMP-binding protein